MCRIIRVNKSLFISTCRGFRNSDKGTNGIIELYTGLRVNGTKRVSLVVAKLEKEIKE